MSINLNGYNVLITGGSSGMGYEMTKTLLSHGATVVIAARNKEKLDKAYETLNSEENDVYAIQMDVTDEESISKASDWYQEKFDHLDLLINNAGVGGNIKGLEEYRKSGQFFDIPTSAFNLIFDTNVLGYFLVSKAFAPMMIKQGKGQIIYTSTSTETMTRKGMVPYGPSKSAGEAMSDVLSKELQDQGVMVNVICPGGFTRTPLATPDMIEFFKKNNMPILEPTVLNRPILFLASKDAQNITGEKVIGSKFDEFLSDHNIKLDY
ncbi:SDR family NAD(P)-dependent oxidoreductase [Companilactobacillus sp.]|jgi:gluconate 5-dehydrogenase|uniref:SDR family NAD(P)-dependent oxidoreductase n=1 Tax=Companilactobacillus sp. TaxID=2767905 RepID=UPI0025B9EDA4|nr:SDR family oxidoreductase [Companilactobacillus sp.]MCH4010041.1 SDR family oxidoreductase [Companilactobacillus sp.]MCH4052283.1 SDR family oxidoreductase [Companilactobacillus sp.]MCH4077983.1 SDR family oxidoreductase [Companilactobacillus sp.]MCH4126559.1 SDR family oxidoreductase [Companilactobacillus sp.]MCH4132145.1 SDR family oxidoreductase [Companilactobacillus sp.]